METETIEKLTPRQLKEKRILEYTGQSQAIKDIIKEATEKQRDKIKKEAIEEFKEENPKTLQDVPAMRGGIFTGRKANGKKVTDREMAQALRRLTMKKTFSLLTMDTKEMEPWHMDLYSKVLVKLAGAILPRIQEITGEDGQELTIHISKEIADKNNITPYIEKTVNKIGQAVQDDADREDLEDENEA